MQHFHKLLLVVSFISVLVFQSCAYYNTFYNAEQYFAEAQRLTRENQLEKVSREELNLYSKAIEKSRKLLAKYPDSKYRDDAQFLIAKAYYFKADYSIAKKYFEDLALDYSASPFAEEVPLWIGRCLMKIGDLEMARHEAARVIKSDAGRSLKADAFLMMGEIALRQDSLNQAENYLERVIDISPDGYTKAQAQFQIGKMRESQKNYLGALESFEAVSRYRPSESLKVEAIIRQTNMLKALGRDDEAVQMIEEMLQSEKFVDIRGQLEIELGKLYRTLGRLDRAENKFISIVEEYNRSEVAAEADFFLGELYLTEKMNYAAARNAYDDIRKQATRSPFVTKGSQRIKQIDRYNKIQSDYVNLQRQLAGLPPLVAKKKSSTPSRSSQRSRSRGRSNSRELERREELPTVSKPKVETPVVVTDTLEVTPEDSLRIVTRMAENRYSLAEYLLFEFGRVDSTLDILNELESSSQDSTLKQRAAYMRYYVLGSVKGDEVAARQSMEHIKEAYPEYFKLIQGDSGKTTEIPDTSRNQLSEIALLFESGHYEKASQRYRSIMLDPDISADIRGKACFNYGLVNDHYLFDKEAAVEAYSFMVDQFPNNSLANTARQRLDILRPEDPVEPQSSEEEPSRSSPVDRF